ncbi:peroxisomal membrane protein 4 [Mycena floridula]|nr:peroxisomal membrane protein 4 [Mycena floridula]
MSTLSTVNALLNQPELQEYLAILKGARNGFVYGVKVRLPHALVMSVLFGRGDWKTRMGHIFKATKQHSFNLAKFVSLYKTLLLIQRKTNNGKERSQDTFIAGLLGGYIVFGDSSAVNEQVVLYVVSRVVASFLPRAGAPAPPGSAVKPRSVDPKWYRIFAAVAWGAVMWLFKHRGDTIQHGMFSSMTYLYRDSESWKDLRTLLWHNK